MRGRFITIEGGEGAGKSTMLKLLANILHPDNGARSLGHNVTPYYFAQHQIDMLEPQNTVQLQGRRAEQCLRLLDGLDELDDVQNVWANLEVEDGSLEASSAG